MWGIWMLVIVAFAGVALLGMALAVGAAPLLAILIFLLAAAVIGAGFVFKRGTEYVKERDAELEGGEAPTSRPGRPRTPDVPKPTGKPVTGEGGDVA
jgi:UPF0716 family protein affecting phage T7 exclusion